MDNFNFDCKSAESNSHISGQSQANNAQFEANYKRMFDSAYEEQQAGISVEPQMLIYPQQTGGQVINRNQLTTCVNLLKNLIRIAEQNNSIVESVAVEAVESLSNSENLTESEMLEIQERIDFLKEINKMNASFNSGLSINMQKNN